MIDGFGNGETWVNRIYHVSSSEMAQRFATPALRWQLEAYFTLRGIRGKPVNGQGE